MIKPLIPRKVQVALRKKRAVKILANQTFPFTGDTSSSSAVSSEKCNVLLTHDVETQEGMARISSVSSIEKEFGVRSNWNFVLSKYEGIASPIEKLSSQGHECGCHGLYHDGLLFSTRDEFLRRLDKIVDISSKLHLKGFRSPSLLRRMEFLKTLDFFDWDSSVPSWDPFQPQPGGCRRYTPFMLNPHTVELPVTLWQDFTLFYELEEADSRIWKAQADRVIEIGGIINIIIHPDYFSAQVQSAYESFLQYLIDSNRVVFKVPSEVADEYRKQKNGQEILG